MIYGRLPMMLALPFFCCEKLMTSLLSILKFFDANSSGRQCQLAAAAVDGLGRPALY
jgi:hypothetical protein